MGGRWKDNLPLAGGAAFDACTQTNLSANKKGGGGASACHDIPAQSRLLLSRKLRRWLLQQCSASPQLYRAYHHVHLLLYDHALVLSCVDCSVRHLRMPRPGQVQIRGASSAGDRQRDILLVLSLSRHGGTWSRMLPILANPGQPGTADVMPSN